MEEPLMETSSILKTIADSVGIGEPALKLLLSILLGYPIAIVHRHFIAKQPPTTQHVFIVSCGLLLGFYNFGIEFLHSTANMLFIYGVLKTIGGTAHSVIIALVFNLTYLLVGYYYTSTESYDIVWTMPQCILTLRLTGLAFDLYDGSLPEAELNKDQKLNRLRELPSLLEVAGYTYFPTSFLVGPQFPMRKYQEFIAGRMKGPTETSAHNISPAIRRFLLGCLYAGLHTFGNSYYPEEYLYSDEYAGVALWKRIVELGIWGHFVLYKYISIWLFTEGSCILIGIAYNGQDASGNSKWDGCANVDLWLFETAQNFHSDYIRSFNINTNNWMMQYIYKRLRFMGNKYYSQLGVLLYLALWHGIHSGYYMCFFMEFISVFMEKDFENVVKRNEVFAERLQDPVASNLKWLVLKIYTLIFMGPCILPLAVLKFDKWWMVYSRTWFFSQIIWGGWILYKPLVKKLLPPRRDRRE
ncbi:hypothetical protein GE061_016083 [Apolygus lucorum]|uniref:Lysophospholipid acyltransferase 5 n=1 Tax=Apolygus lucorum TaxID=248454 RepID=A0A6A4K3Q4_APOLU|nr:hypothetical protein GE061_016083 [Apolygus lucorum]